jgi:hypothetical protein
MRLRRFLGQLRQLHWTAIAVDLVILVLGVFLGIQAANWNQARVERERSGLLLEALRSDLNDYLRVTDAFGKQARAGLDAFDAAIARGEHPAPYVMRFRGSDKPPMAVWQVAMQGGLADLVHPSLTVQTGFFYSEVDGVAEKYGRYAEFVESRILPYRDDPQVFYDADGRLKPEFRQNLQRLREWAEDSETIAVSARCLLGRFEKPKEAGPSCRPNYGTFDEVSSTPAP